MGSLERLPVTRRQPTDGAAARWRWRRPPISSFVGAPHPPLHDHPTVATLQECWCGQTDVRVPAGRRPCRGFGAAVASVSASWPNYAAVGRP